MDENFDDKNLDNVASFFKKAAAGEGADRSIIKAKKEKPLPSFLEDFKSSAYLRNLSEKDLMRAGQELGKVGLTGFSYVGEGNKAHCFVSNGQAVRIGNAPSNREPTRLEAKYITRTFCPLAVQPDHKIHFLKASVYVEVLPFLSMIDDLDIPKKFAKLLPDIFEGTCFKANAGHHIKDLGLMEDGTPLYVDPDAFRLRDWEVQPTQKDFDLIRENCERLELPEPLSWVLPDGRFKQDLFYPKPAEQLDLVI